MLKHSAIVVMAVMVIVFAMACGAEAKSAPFPNTFEVWSNACTAAWKDP